VVGDQVETLDVKADAGGRRVDLLTCSIFVLQLDVTEIGECLAPTVVLAPMSAATAAVVPAQLVRKATVKICLRIFYAPEMTLAREIAC